MPKQQAASSQRFSRTKGGANAFGAGSKAAGAAGRRPVSFAGGKRSSATAAPSSQQRSMPSPAALSVAGLSKSYLDENEKRAAFTCAQLVGYTVSVQVKDGKWYEGIFHSANPRDFSVVLRKVTVKGQRTRPRETMEIKQSDLVQIIATVETEPRASAGQKTGLMTDGAISRGGRKGNERTLKSFTDFDSGVEQKTLEEEARSGRPWDQFAANERLTGKKQVRYDESMYTTKLDQRKVTKELAAKADAAAKEILSRSSKNSVINRDRGRTVQGQDSESMFSGVRRDDAAGTKGRYVPPHRQGASGTSEGVKPSNDAKAPKKKVGGSWASVVNPDKASSATEKTKTATSNVQKKQQQQKNEHQQKPQAGQVNTAGRSGNSTDRSKAMAALKESQKTIETRLNKKFSETSVSDGTDRKELQNKDSENSTKKKEGSTSGFKLSADAAEFTMNVDAQEFKPSFSVPTVPIPSHMHMGGMPRPPAMGMNGQMVVPMAPNGMLPAYSMMGAMPPQGSRLPVMPMRRGGPPQMGHRMTPMPGAMGMMGRGPMMHPGQMAQMQQQHMAHVLPPQKKYEMRDT